MKHVLIASTLVLPALLVTLPPLAADSEAPVSVEVVKSPTAEMEEGGTLPIPPYIPMPR
jgi:hypothetical protein